MSRKSRTRKANLPHLYLSIAICVIALVVMILCGTIALSRMFGGGAVIQYGLAAPDDRVIYMGVDLTRNIRLTKNEPLPAILFSAADTAPDGRQVITAQTEGNVDLFLVKADGIRTRLTHFIDFPIHSDERAARRANLYPSWSPDNQWIAFISSTPNGKLDLYTVHPDGSALHHLGDRIRAAAPYTPHWVTFDAELPPLWLIMSAESSLFLIGLLKGYNRSGSYSG